MCSDIDGVDAPFRIQCNMNIEDKERLKLVVEKAFPSKLKDELMNKKYFIPCDIYVCGTILAHVLFPVISIYNKESFEYLHIYLDIR